MAQAVLSPPGSETGPKRLWAGGRGLTLTLKQQSRHEHGDTTLWEASFASHSDLDAGTSFCQKENGLRLAKKRGTPDLSKGINVGVLLSRHDNSSSSGSHRSVAFYPC